MKKYFTYESHYAPYIEGILEEKERKGLLKSTMFKCYMLEFDRFFRDHDIKDNTITEDIILQWRATRTNDNERNLYHKYIAWIHLCRYMHSLGIECYIPRTPINGRQNDYIPYVFTHNEIEKLFETADMLETKVRSYSSKIWAIPAILRLLYSTGMRIGEALSLKNEDLDFKNQIIYINNTKNGHQRLAAMNESLFSVLLQYRDFKNKIHLGGNSLPCNFFFVSQRGTPYKYDNILSLFHKVLYYSDVPKQAYINRPRIHDIRHTAAVHSLQKLVKNGTDIYCALPLVSTFLGHKNICSSEMYLKLTHEMYPDIIKQESITAFVFPKATKSIDVYDGFC